LVPLLLAAYFFGQHQITGFVFCLFFFFENWLYTATYMADARAQILPLVTTGDPDFVEHDFHAIFSHLGVLSYDTRIAAVVRILGWCGMLAVLFWFTVQGWKRRRELKQGPDFSVLSRFTAQRKPLQVPLFSDREKSETAVLQADHSEITNAPNLR
jgi:hypothetical protein